MTYLWTSEAVSSGHPDKLADQIADAILDANLAVDPKSRCACEVTLTSNLAFVTGEVSSRSPLTEDEVESIVRKTICRVGYDDDSASYDGHKIKIINTLKEQSSEISRAVTNNGELGAGDQGIMFGYASNEFYSNSRQLMPLTHSLAFSLIDLIEEHRHRDRLNRKYRFLPDAKSQVTVVYDNDGTPKHVDTILLSTCHYPEFTLDSVKEYFHDLIKPRLAALSHLITEDTKYLINPAGTWNVGGPESDTGLSGRKIVVDNYGADCPVGGGSFSGKDPTKVDRSGAYLARYLAKNVVAAGLADKCQVQLSYAIGVSEPISLRVQTFGGSKDCNGKSNDTDIETKLRSLISMKPKEIIKRFNLCNPMYQETASGGHFGRPSFPWEALDLIESLKN